MCGIVGTTASDNVVPVLLDGLKRLEYRGYDSAGVVVSSGDGLQWEKCSGKISRLEERLRGTDLSGTVGLGHTRWATHGRPTEANAHPHFSCRRCISVVHNGIIENFIELREKLIAEGHKFRSQTDTEIIAHLIEKHHKGDPLRAVARATKALVGSYALGVLFADHPRTLVAARRNSPLVIGVGEGRTFLASDISALLPHTRRVILLDENESAILLPDSVKVFGADLEPRRAVPKEVDWTLETAEKGGYPHYMLKEIHEQPRTVATELAGRLRGNLPVFAEVPKSLPKRIKRITIAACGTAWHAGLVAKCALEELAQIPVDVGFASELRYADRPYDKSSLLIAISQSGETADTLAAARIAKEAGAPTLAITNIRGSTLSREADSVIHMRAGLEIGVAATKTYTSQLMNVLLLAIAFGRTRGTLPTSRARKLLRGIRSVEDDMGRILADPSEIQKCVEKFRSGYDFMYIGRRYNLATAFEGALKMKEISYLHAEGYGGGEMKHGPLAIVDKKLTTAAIAVQSRVYSKMLANIEEIRTRGGRVISVATEGDEKIRSLSDHVLYIPPCEEMFTPVYAVVPLQLFAYHTAVANGKNVDQPRNLAKSVTVE